MSLGFTDRYLESKGREDPVHPQLICLGHSDIWTTDLVRLSFDDPLRRVAIVNIASLPRFQEKTSIPTIESILEKARREKMDKRRVNVSFAKQIADLKREREIYGFTREEQAFLESISII